MSKEMVRKLFNRRYSLGSIAQDIVDAKVRGAGKYLAAINRLSNQDVYVCRLPDESPAVALSVDGKRMSPAEVIAYAARNDSDERVQTGGQVYRRSEMQERAAKAAIAKRARKLAKEFGIRIEERKGSSSKYLYVWAPERVYAEEIRRWGRPKAIPGGYSPAEPRTDPHSYHSAYGWDKALEMIRRYIDDMRLGASGLNLEQAGYLLTSTDPYLVDLLAAWFAGENVAGVIADYLEEEKGMSGLADVLRCTILAPLDMVRAADPAVS